MRTGVEVVVTDHASDSSTFPPKGTDASVGSRVSNIVWTRDIQPGQSAAFSVHTEGTTVTATGRVSCNAQRQRVLQLARETEGVRDVVDRPAGSR